MKTYHSRVEFPNYTRKCSCSTDLSYYNSTVVCYEGTKIFDTYIAMILFIVELQGLLRFMSFVTSPVPKKQMMSVTCKKNC